MSAGVPLPQTPRSTVADNKGSQNAGKAGRFDSFSSSSFFTNLKNNPMQCGSGASNVISVIFDKYLLDDYDYELARQADKDESTETISFDAVLAKYGLTYDDL